LALGFAFLIVFVIGLKIRRVPEKQNIQTYTIQEFPSGRLKIVNNYNKNMGGVDTTDAIMKA
jgi:hypothetical protein